MKFATFFLLITSFLSYHIREACLGTKPLSTKCHICNRKIKFVNDGLYGCALMDSENCLEIDSRGLCKECAPGYSRSMGGCFISPVIPDEGCMIYKSPQKCHRCKKNLQMNQHGKCGPVYVSGLVLNCEYYLTAGRCFECTSGYLLRDSNCVLPNIPHCAVFTPPSCGKCKPGFTLAQNGDNMEAIESYIASALEERMILSNRADAACKVSVENCAKYQTIQNLYSATCRECEAGYYLSDNKCLQIPRPIEYCLKYNSEGNCEICEAGRVAAGTACVAVNDFHIPDCLASNFENTCAFCDSTTFLSASETACMPLQKVVQNCVVYN